MKVFYPTEEEFLKPMLYIDRLMDQGVTKYGCIKIVPPKSFSPPFAYDMFSDKKLPTRYQVL